MSAEKKQLYHLSLRPQLHYGKMVSADRLNPQTSPWFPRGSKMAAGPTYSWGRTPEPRR